MYRLLTCIMILSIAMAGTPAFSVVPNVMSYQGKLSDTSGQFVTDGQYTMTFAIFSVASGGSALWQESDRPVDVSGGVFTVQLGEQVPLPPSIFNGNRWLQVTVNGSTLTPRTNLASTGFAFRAHTAEHVLDTAAVRSLNSLTGNVTLAAGDNISIQSTGNTLTVSGASIPNPLPVSQSGNWNVGITGTPPVSTPTQSNKVQLWSTNQMVDSGQTIFSPSIETDGYKEARIVLYTTGTFSQPELVRVIVRFRTAQAGLLLIGTGDFAASDQEITNQGNFTKTSNVFSMTIPVMSDAMRVEVRNDRASSITINAGSWVYLVN